MQPGIIRVHRLRARAAGRYTHVDAHVIVPEYWTVVHSHEVLDAFAARVIDALPIDGEMILHGDPCRRALCAICNVADCPERVEPFEARPPITLDEAVATDEAFWGDRWPLPRGGRLLNRAGATPDRCPDDGPRARPPAARRPGVGHDGARRGGAGDGARPVPHPDRVPAVAAHEGRDHRAGVGAALRPGGHARRHAGAARRDDRARHLPGRLLPHQGPRPASRVPRPDRALRRPRAVRPRRAPHAARRRAARPPTWS